MAVILTSKVKLLSLPRSKISWIKTIPLSPSDNGNGNGNQTVVAKIMMLTSENELRYFQLESQWENQTTVELKVGENWTHSFGNGTVSDESVEILLVDPETRDEDMLIITKESSGLGFYTKNSTLSSSSLSSSSAATRNRHLDKKGIDIRWSNAFESTPEKFTDRFVMGNIWCGLNFDNADVNGGSVTDCAREKPRIGAVFHDPQSNSTSFYFLQKLSILNAPSVTPNDDEGKDTLFPLDKILVVLPAEVQGALEKIWIIPPPSSSSQSKNENDVVVFQKDGRLFLFQLDEFNQLDKLGDLKLPTGFPGMENPNSDSDEMAVQSLSLFESDAFSLAVTFKSITVIFSLDENTQIFRRSSFFYFGKEQAPLFFQGPEELRKAPKDEKGNQRFFFLLDGPRSLGYSSDSLDFRSISPKNPKEMNLPYLKVIATTSFTPLNSLQPTMITTSTRILFFEDNGVIFAVPLKLPKNSNSNSRFFDFGLNSEKEGVVWDFGQERDRLDGDDCFDGNCLMDLTSFNSALLTSASASASEKDSAAEKLGNTGIVRRSLWDKSILDLISVKQMAESVDLPTGQVQFDLQLIPLIGFSLSYTSNADSESSSFYKSVLGHDDWQISSHPFVVRVRSLFEKLDKFYLVFQSQSHPLTLTSTTTDSTGNPVLEFTASTAPQYTKILYHSSTSASTITSNLASTSTGRNYWEFESEGAIAFFGQVPNFPTDFTAIQFQHEARAAGSLSSKFPVEWHLTRFVNHVTSQTFDYKYRSFNPNPNASAGSDPISNQKWNQIEPQALFISSVKSIPSANRSNKLELDFQYREAGAAGNRQLFFDGYTMKTESYQQTVKFQFDSSSSLLTGIEQQFNGSWKEMLKFSYSKHSVADVPFRPFDTVIDLSPAQNQNQNQEMTNLLSIVEFPTLKTKVQFTFTQPTVSQLPRRPENTINVNNAANAVAAHGFGFSVVAVDNFLHFYKHTDGSVQTVRFAEANEIGGLEKVNVVLRSSCAFLHLRERSKKQVRIVAYCYTTNPVGNELNWKRVAEKTFPYSSSTSIILTQDGTIFTVDQSAIGIHEWTETSESPDGSVLSSSSSSSRPPTYSWTTSSISNSRSGANINTASGVKSKFYWDVTSSQWRQLTVQENWVVPNSDTVDIKLNESGLKLVKTGREDTLKLRVGGELVKNLGIKTSAQLTNFFPEYMVTLPADRNTNGFHLFEFPSTDKSVAKETRVEGENILQGLTSSQILVTLIQSTISHSGSSLTANQIRLRTMTFRPQPVLTQVTIDGGKYLKRKAGYDYSDTGILANGRLIFGKRKVIPGAQPQKTGWMEYTDSFHGNPKVYDSLGNFTGRMQQWGDSGNEETSYNANYNLLDVTETQQILNTHPYLASECQVGYFGFQEYEKKSSAEDCREWTFPADQVMSNGFPLTGSRFLRLKYSNPPLSTSFLVDSEIGEDYTVSAWVQSGAIKLEDTISPILKAKIQGLDQLTWLSKIVLEEDGWFLLEINILSHELDAYKETLFSNNNNNNPTIGQDLRVFITIAGQKVGKIDYDVDVDHILYAPSGWNSEITVFDPSTLRVTDRILGRSGLLSHHKFDAFGKPLAQINSEGSVMHHEIRSTSSQGTVNSDGLVATAKFEVLGAAGWFESCNPSLKQSLTLGNRKAWRLSPGFAHHVGWSKSTNSQNGESLLFKIKDQESFLFRFTYDIDIPSFSNLAKPGILLQYKNTTILSIGKNSGPRANTAVKLNLNQTIFSTAGGSFELEIPPISSISFGLLMNDRALVWIGDELKLDAQFSPEATLSIIQSDWKNLLAIEARGSVSFGDILILPDPKLTMSYSNIFGEKIQEIEVVSEGQIRVSQIMYDELGRSQAVTKPTVINVNATDPMLSFRSDFITSFQEEGIQMRMDGDVNARNPKDDGAPFTMVKYGANSFSDIVVEEGRPGVHFSIGGKFQKIYSIDNPPQFIQHLYPENEGFQYRSSKNQNSQSFYEEVTVYTKDSDGSEITHASAIISQTGKNLLATYDYDDRGHLIASHSPEFHAHYHSTFTGVSWENLRKARISNDPKTLATFYKYDDRGRLVQKSSPDMGVVNMIYEGQSDKLKYTIHRVRENLRHIDSVRYYEYKNEGGSLSQVGILKGFESKTSPNLVFNSGSSFIIKVPRRVVKTQENSKLANIFFKTDLIVSSFGENNANSTLFDDYVELVDTKINTINVQTRTALFPTKPGIPALLVPTSFQHNAQGDKLLRINVPFQDYGILYRYDTLGQLSAISITAPNSVTAGGLFPGVFDIANYFYNGNGDVIREHLHGFNKKDALDTKFSYNSPGFPIERKNEFIKLSWTYEDDGYGDKSTGTTSSVMSSSTTRFWEDPEGKFYRDASDFIELGISPQIAKLCYSKLVEFGYIREEKVVKMFHSKMDTRFPLVCTSGISGEQIQKVFTEKVLKSSLPFSFKYQYGFHRDLVKVKFVVEENGPNANKNQPFCSKPLTTETFLGQIQLVLKSPEIDEAGIKSIWEKLLESGFLVRAAENGLFSQIHWKPGKSFFNPSLLNTFLKDNIFDFTPVNLMMEHLASTVGIEIQDDSDNQLKTVLNRWTPAVQELEGKAETLVRNLRTDGFLSNSQGQVVQVNQTVFHPEFLAALQFNSDFSSSSGQSATVKGVVYKTLLSYFNCDIGSSPLDREVIETDMNGNFKLFYNGLERVEIDYLEWTNRIKLIKVTSSLQRQKQYKITHDPCGNLNSAAHHHIEKIVYDEITAKPILMQLTDGKILKFRYDLRGKRVTKEIIGPSGALLKKIKYLSRDEHGRSLLEEEFTFVSPKIPPKTRTTLFIYNPDRSKGLVGFIRSGKLYNVFTDNINSVRLVVLDGHVVGAWDYSPYGTTISEYIQHEDASIPYRFSGQEQDEETGLYNFHARIYDPFLGRFYQIDPKEQFFSPYKYAGNTALDVIDPDGREIFDRIRANTLATTGAYFGGSAANNNWNPAKFKWDKPGSYLGSTGGAAGGSFIFPGGETAISLTTPALSTARAGLAMGKVSAGGAYFLAASANQEWDSRSSDFKSPGTYNAFFARIAMGAAHPSDISSYKDILGTCSKPGQVFFTGATVSNGVGVGYLSATSANQNYAFWEWDFSSPASASCGVSGFSSTLRGAPIFNSGRYSSKQHKITYPGYRNVAREIQDIVRGKQWLRASDSSTTAETKIIGTATPNAMSGYILVAAASDGWILVDWTNARTHAALISGMGGGWIAGSGIPQDGQYPRKSVTMARRSNNVNSWFSRAENSLWAKHETLISYVNDLKRQPTLRRNSTLRGSIAGASRKLKLPLTPTSQLAQLGNSKWRILGFSGQGKSGVVYFLFNPTVKQNRAPSLASASGSSRVNESGSNAPSKSSTDNFNDFQRDGNILAKIAQERENILKMILFFGQLDSDGKQPFLEKIKTLFCDASSIKNDNKKAIECDEKSRTIAVLLENLTNANLRDGTFGIDWELRVQSVIEWAEKKIMIKSLLKELETRSKISKLGDNLISANRRLRQLQLQNPNPSPNPVDQKYTAISNYIKKDIFKAVQKSIVKKQGFYNKQAGIIALHITNQMTDKKLSLSNWAPSNCGKAVALPEVFKSRKLLRLDKDNRIRQGGVNYVAIYNPRSMLKNSRCSQCVVNKETLDVEQLKFILTNESWLTTIDDVFFRDEESSSVKARWNRRKGNQLKATQLGIAVEQAETDDGYEDLDESIIVNARRSRFYVNAGGSSSSRSSAASLSHGGIIQSIYKTVKSFVSRAIPKFPTFDFDLHLNLDLDFWTTGASGTAGEELKLQSFVKDKNLFENQHVSSGEKSEESGNDQNQDRENAFSSRCLPFYTKGHREFSDDSFGLSCTAAHGQIIVFYPDPQQQQQQQQNGLPLLNRISGVSSTSSSSQSSGNQLHFFDKHSCQFLTSFHGQNAAFCQGSSSNVLYIPNRPVPPLDSLNDQLLLLLLAQHFLQKWFKSNAKTNDDDHNQDDDKDDNRCPESESTENSETEKKGQLLTQDELTNFEWKVRAEAKRLREVREGLILQLKTQQKKQGGFKINQSFLHFCHFYIDDLDEEFSREVEKSKTSGFSSHRRTEYLERLMEIEVEMQENFQALTQFQRRSDSANSNADFSSEKKTGYRNSMWNFVHGMFYSSHHHKSQ